MFKDKYRNILLGQTGTGDVLIILETFFEERPLHPLKTIYFQNRRFIFMDIKIISGKERQKCKSELQIAGPTS